jgi:uncharacterized protein
MPGETNLQVLLRNMTPHLDEDPYGIVVAAQEKAVPVDEVFSVIHEQEGSTLIARQAVLVDSGYAVDPEWARITLQIHSSLQAIGLTAAFATALGNAGISANVVAGFHHDHVFVQWERRHAALSALQALSKSI